MRPASRLPLRLIRALGARAKSAGVTRNANCQPLDADHRAETAAPGSGGSLARRGGLLSWLRGAGNGREESVERRPPRGLGWPLRLLTAASLAVPLLLLGLAAWQNLRLVQVQAEQRVSDETGQMHEHAISALETYALILAWVDDRIRGLDWDRIEHDRALHSFLLEIETLPQIGAVSIIDASGHIRASGHPLPALLDVSDLDPFVAQKQRDAGIYIGHEHMDPLTNIRDFEISRRRTTPDGGFDGVIAVSVRSEYFSDFFSTVSRDEDFSASLLLSDGSVLVRYPPTSASAQPVFSADAPVMRAISADPDNGSFWGRGSVDGVKRLFGYQRIGGYPLYVAFGIPARDIIAAWRANLVDYLWFAAPASLGLFCMTLFAMRQLRQQKVASWRWRRTAQRLKREMDRRTRAEAELHQAQKMEALGQLTGGVAHDFNNLLTVLQGCLELLSGRQRDDRLEGRVEMALRTLERGKMLTGQLLAFARRQPLTVARVDLNRLLNRMDELLTQTVGSSIRVVNDLAPDLWPVDTDATQLELAVINLAINARDAMPGGGVLRLRTFNATLTPRAFDGGLGKGGDFVGLEISDTGTGMPPEVQARAFEPFFTSKESGKGTGLGLSMVYGFARQSGGSASIRSEVGRGTTVTLLLPRAEADVAAGESDATDLPPDTTA